MPHDNRPEILGGAIGGIENIPLPEPPLNGDLKTPSKQPAATQETKQVS